VSKQPPRQPLNGGRKREQTWTPAEGKALNAQYDAARLTREPVPKRLLAALTDAPLEHEYDGGWKSRVDIERRREQADLPERPLRCLELASYGLTNPMIAETLGISHGTVQTHMKRAKFILAAKDRTHAVAIALRRGLIR